MANEVKNKVSPEVLSRVASLAGLVQYADAAIVSKTLIDKNAGTVTLFAFDAGQSLSTHSAPFDAMVQVLDGESLITIAQQPYKVSAGGIIVMPADVPHSVAAEKRFKMLLTMIRQKN